MITHAPTGKLVTGHVLDVNKKAFVEALKNYDRQLYVKWNPKKVKGWGCWEIRRKPEFMVPVDAAEYKGDLYLKVDYREIDLVHHVLDCAYLNYSQLNKLREMDLWANKNHWINNIDAAEAEARAKAVQKLKEERAYKAKYYKNAISDFKEFIRSGGNPNLIAGYWDKK